MPQGAVTFLFTDIEGSTRLWALNRAAMSASLALHDRVLRERIESNVGYVFSRAGDSFAAAFGRASERSAPHSRSRHSFASWSGQGRFCGFALVCMWGRRRNVTVTISGRC